MKVIRFEGTIGAALLGLLENSEGQLDIALGAIVGMQQRLLQEKRLSLITYECIQKENYSQKGDELILKISNQIANLVKEISDSEENVKRHAFCMKENLKQIEQELKNIE